MRIEGPFVKIIQYFTIVYVGRGIIDAHDAAMKARLGNRALQTLLIHM